MSFSHPPENLLVPLAPIYDYLFRRLGVISQADPTLLLTSWYRTEATNAAVGGSPESQHLLGFAVDVETDFPEQVEQFARGLGLIGVNEFDHVHLQIFPAGFLRSIGLFR